MTESNDARSDDVFIYPEKERPRLNEMSSEQFNKEFASFKELLVNLDGEEVVAATRGLDRSAVVQSFCDRFQLQASDLENYTFELGAAALSESTNAVAKMSFAQRLESSPTSSPRSPNK